MTEFDNTYGVIPCLHTDTGREVYMVVRFDGYSFPERGVYSTLAAAERVAEKLNIEACDEK